MRIRIGSTVKTRLDERITITGYRSIRGKYIYLFKDEFNSKGFVTRANLLDALNDGARIIS